MKVPPKHEQESCWSPVPSALTLPKPAEPPCVNQIVEPSKTREVTLLDVDARTENAPACVILRTLPEVPTIKSVPSVIIALASVGPEYVNVLRTVPLESICETPMQLLEYQAVTKR